MGLIRHDGLVIYFRRAQDGRYGTIPALEGMDGRKLNIEGLAEIRSRGVRPWMPGRERHSGICRKRPNRAVRRFNLAMEHAFAATAIAGRRGHQWAKPPVHASAATRAPRSPQGHLRIMLFEGGMNAERFIEFLKRPKIAKAQAAGPDRFRSLVKRFARRLQSCPKGPLILCSFNFGLYHRGLNANSAQRSD